MSSALTLARPYARAAFETALARSALAGWAEKLAFAAEVAADPRVVALFGNPRLGGSQLASLFLPQGEKTDGDFGHFISLLAENGRLPVLPEIGALFEQLKLESERTLKVRLRTAVRVDTPELEKISAALKRRFNRDIELTQSIDPKMLGGAVIDAGEVVIDGSVRGRLARLEQALTH
ncbi:MAG: F0F1 ATP synthase subunit delta [Dokdonella sp.]|uniref:F0F1 ATP synthase subunit delta n=1 Tax=Dokdonella sp. TaxID=2291710 RepID=UPI002B5116F4|nr:F0F1 ATP synthase subunit delta [Dokdonella sp.]HOX70558.1 F0F1 ATP synthase subunit delta [Dokdonella sp.]HPG94332.1 F0F1 ATP synthase subunit delta [Dokdonella sp.]